MNWFRSVNWTRVGIIAFLVYQVGAFALAVYNWEMFVEYYYLMMEAMQ